MYLINKDNRIVNFAVCQALYVEPYPAAEIRAVGPDGLVQVMLKATDYFDINQEKECKALVELVVARFWNHLGNAEKFDFQLKAKAFAAQLRGQG